MTADEARLLLAERDFLRREVANLTEQVKLVVRAEHGLTRSRRAVDRQLRRIRRLADFALSITGTEALAEILARAREALLDFFELDEAAIVHRDSFGPALVPRDAAEPASLAGLFDGGPSVVESNEPAAVRLLQFLAEHAAGPAPECSPRAFVLVPLRSRANERVALLVAWSSRSHAHHRDLPGAEHLSFLELFGSHVTRALDNAALTAELRSKNQQLSASLAHLERTQAQLVQAQKLEALGRLAGGIAHDFNNLLTLIVGAAQLLKPAVEGSAQAEEELDAILGATQRAAAITRRLLAFGRQQEHKQELVDLNALIIDLSRMLRRLISDDIALELNLDPRVAPVSADPVQLEQIIMNLVLNARDATSKGGTVTLSTHSAPATDAARGSSGAPETVTFRVIDTGAGMDESVRKQLFEPFFTTKPVGKGTGLGLATVYGLVKQNNGHITVQSELGRGSDFAVALPVARASSEPPELDTGPAPGASILLAEDEDGIRRVASRVLRAAGYDVHEARDGLAALELALRLPTLDLVVTDVVMPNLGGPEFVRRLRATRPALPVVFMSGHTFNDLDTGSLDREIDYFLPKPFAPHELRAAVEKRLQSAAALTVQPV
jgi:signal transduction histidine kinase/ActR/RegA family two-component response regulator